MEWKLTKEAEEAKVSVAESNDSEHSFGGSDGFWYDITDGGYFKPEKALSDSEQIAKVREAVKLLEDLEENVYQRIVQVKIEKGFISKVLSDFQSEFHCEFRNNGHARSLIEYSIGKFIVESNNPTIKDAKGKPTTLTRRIT